MKKVIFSLLMVSLLAACASEKPKEEVKQQTPVIDAQQPAPVVSATKIEEPKAAESAETKVGETANASNAATNIPDERSAYYPFDVATVQHADITILQAHAKYLSDHPDQKVQLEGNCDERGSAEYNLALGHRRANGVKKVLIIGGARSSQITTISYGKERSKLNCHEEKCWKENRRTDLNYIK
jgi:peptidoglycan-associated lipoprotein